MTNLNFDLTTLVTTTFPSEQSSCMHLDKSALVVSFITDYKRCNSLINLDTNKYIYIFFFQLQMLI